MPEVSSRAEGNLKIQEEGCSWFGPICGEQFK